MKSQILPKRLKTLREEKGYLQKYVADKIGVRSNTLSGYENGTRMPDPDTIVRLAELYNVTTDYLLGHSSKPQLTEQQEFENFVKDPELKRWVKELPKSKEEDLARLKKMWEFIKEEMEDDE